MSGGPKVERARLPRGRGVADNASHDSGSAEYAAGIQRGITRQIDLG